MGAFPFIKDRSNMMGIISPDSSQPASQLFSLQEKVQ